jgi:hypothetical protein
MLLFFFFTHVRFSPVYYCWYYDYFTYYELCVEEFHSGKYSPTHSGRLAKDIIPGSCNVLSLTLWGLFNCDEIDTSDALDLGMPVGFGVYDAGYHNSDYCWYKYIENKTVVSKACQDAGLIFYGSDSFYYSSCGPHYKIPKICSNLGYDDYIYDKNDKKYYCIKTKKEFINLSDYCDYVYSPSTKICIYKKSEAEDLSSMCSKVTTSVLSNLNKPYGAGIFTPSADTANDKCDYEYYTNSKTVANTCAGLYSPSGTYSSGVCMNSSNSAQNITGDSNICAAAGAQLRGSNCYWGITQSSVSAVDLCKYFHNQTDKYKPANFGKHMDAFYNVTDDKCYYNIIGSDDYQTLCNNYCNMQNLAGCWIQIPGWGGWCRAKRRTI